MIRKRNTISTNPQETETVIFRIVTIKKNKNGIIEYLVLRDLNGNTLHLPTNNNETNINIKYIQCEILVSDYEGMNNRQIDSRMISNIRSIHESELIPEVHETFNTILQETSGEARVVIRQTNDRIQKMVLSFVDYIKWIDKRTGIETTKARYENIAGNIVDLNLRGDGIKESEFIEITVDVEEYNFRINEQRKKYPNNQYFLFYATCLRRPYVEYLDNVDTEELDQLMNEAWEKEGQNGIFMGYEDLRRRFLENSIELEFNIPTPRNAQQVDIIENNGLSKRQLAQQARRERERALKASQKPSIANEEYELIVQKLHAALKEVNILTERISHLERLLATSQDEIEKIKEERDILRERLRLAGERATIARNVLGTDLDILRR